MPLGATVAETPIVRYTDALADGWLRLRSGHGFDGATLRAAFAGTPVGEAMSRADLERTILVDAVVDPDGLRPRTAKCRSITTATPKVGPIEEQQNLQTWQFDWG